MKKQAMFIIFMILMTGLFATTIYIPEDYATIQGGIDASEDGDEIIVSPGTYVENINFEGKAIILGSLFYTTQDTSYISQTIIAGNQDNSVVRFQNEEDSTSVLTGFTITNGHSHNNGGGIFCHSSSPSLENVTITGNSAEDDGGGIYCFLNSSPSLENVTITDNSASLGGGIYCNESSPSLENVTIADNSAQYEGGGIYYSYSSPSLVNVTITDNSASENGGGIYCQDGSSPGLENVTITGNSAEEDGGGIYCSYSSPSLVNVTITDNYAEYNGGGISCYDYSSPSLVNVTITHNSADVRGGGIYCSSSGPILANVSISDNSAESMGGGICCTNYSSPVLENVTIADNSTYYCGGGIYCDNYSSPSLANVTITGNSAESDGGGIYCWQNSSPTLVNCIFWNNSPQEVEFSSDLDPNTITIAYSDIDGGEEGIQTNNNGAVNWLEGNIDADPLFVNAEMGNYLLTEDSPCIDAGIAFFEYEGEVLIDLSVVEYYGIAPDMGAYEYDSVEEDDHIIQNSKLKIQNFPNPFNPETNILFELSADSNVLLEIYNIKGQKVTTLVNDHFKAGSHTVIWNAAGQSSGIYLLRFITAEKSELKKLILLK